MIFNMHNQNVRTVALVVLGLTYLFFGAAVFNVIEKDREGIDSELLYQQEAALIEKYNITEDDLRRFTAVLIKLEPHKAGRQWDFTGALYFAIILLTTIGYGHSVPRTTSGKIFCMFYSLIGVPLYLVMFQAMGERINNAARYSMKRIGRKLGFKCTEVSLSTLVPFGLFSCVLTVTIGAVSFSHFEGWPLLDSFYYCVVTLTTIGFGDYVPLQQEEALQKKPNYVVFSFIYILVGLTIIGAFVNLVVLRLMVTTATDESPKDEETEEDMLDLERDVGEDGRYITRDRRKSFSGSSYGEGTDFSLPIDYYEGETISAQNGGPFAKMYSLPYTQDLESMWQDNVDDGLAGISRRQQSFRTSRENRFQYHPSANTTKPHFSAGDLYSLYGDPASGEVSRVSSRKQVDPVSKADRPISEIDAEGSHDERNNRSGASTLSPPNQATQGSSNNPPVAKPVFPENGYVKWGCVLCARSCVVCQHLFGDHPVSDDVFEDDLSKNNAKNKFDIDDEVLGLGNGNDSNNKQFASSKKDIKNGPQNGLDFVLNGYCLAMDAITLHMTSPDSRPHAKFSGSSSLRHSRSMPPNSHINVKMLLEPKPNRPRNLSLDSGYGGMWSVILDDNTTEGSRRQDDQNPTTNRFKQSTETSEKGRNIEVTPRSACLTLPSDTPVSDSWITSTKFNSPLSLSSTADVASLDEDAATGSRSACSLLTQATVSKSDRPTERVENQNLQFDFASITEEADRPLHARDNFEFQSGGGMKNKSNPSEPNSPALEMPAIVVTLCEPTSAQSPNADERTTHNDNNQNQNAYEASQEECNGQHSATLTERGSRDRARERRDFEKERRAQHLLTVKNMCYHHHRQYEQLSKIFNGGIQKKHLDSTVSDIDANMGPVAWENIHVATTRNNLKPEPEAKGGHDELIATRICSNGSVVTDAFNIITPRTSLQDIQGQHSAEPYHSSNELPESPRNADSDGPVLVKHTPNAQNAATTTAATEIYMPVLPSPEIQNGKNVTEPSKIENKRSKRNKFDILRHFLSKTKENGKQKPPNGILFHEKEISLPCEYSKANSNKNTAAVSSCSQKPDVNAFPRPSTNFDGAPETSRVSFRRQYAFGISAPETQRNDEVVISEGHVEHRRVASCCSSDTAAAQITDEPEYFLAKSMPRLHRENWDTSYC